MITTTPGRKPATESQKKTVSAVPLFSVPATIKFYVTEEEKRLIDEKMKQLPIKQYGAYLRKMAIDGYILVIDRSDTKAYIRELQAVSRNINQIAKRANATGAVYQQDIEDAQQLYEKKLLTYPRTDSQYLIEDMGQTAQHLVSDLLRLLPIAQGLALTPDVGRVLNSKKVSDHHAIIPTAEFAKQGFTGLAESECKLMNLVCAKLLCAVAVPHEYETVTAVFSCAGNEFTAKGKTVLVPGWKEIDQRFRSTLKADTEEEVLHTLPELAEGQSFSVTANVLEHFTSPPKAYTEDTLLSAMERAGAEDMPEDKVNCSAGAREGGLGHAERKGLGTPATRACLLYTSRCV